MDSLSFYLFVIISTYLLKFNYFISHVAIISWANAYYFNKLSDKEATSIAKKILTDPKALKMRVNSIVANAFSQIKYMDILQTTFKFKVLDGNEKKMD